MFTSYKAVESEGSNEERKKFYSNHPGFKNTDLDQSLDYDALTKSSDFSDCDRGTVNKHIDEIQRFINYFKEAI